MKVKSLFRALQRVVRLSEKLTATVMKYSHASQLAALRFIACQLKAPC
jgi:hypothetical protein